MPSRTLHSLKASPELAPIVNELFVSFKNFLEKHFSIIPNFYSGSFLEEIDTYRQQPHADVLVLFEEGIPIGCVAYHPFQTGTAEIKRLYVYPSSQGRGYGRYLMEAAIQAIGTEQGYTTVWLDTDERLGLSHFYENLGFLPISSYHQQAHEGNVMLYFELKL